MSGPSRISYNARMAAFDVLQRPMHDLRISVTDRCNFRCTYCMPFDEYTWIGRQEVLSFEEIERLARIFVGFGIQKIRLTGGEPLVRKGLAGLISRLAKLEGLGDLSLTTNGALLSEQAEALYSAGLRRINVSIDTLKAERFRALTKRGNLDEVLAGLFAAKKAGMSPVKINAVIIRGTNDDEFHEIENFIIVSPPNDHGVDLDRRHPSFLGGEEPGKDLIQIAALRQSFEPVCSKSVDADVDPPEPSLK